FETTIITRLEEAKRRLEEYEEQNAYDGMEEEPAPQESEFNEEFNEQDALLCLR
ncbi:hypothetical protein LOAG_10601, partial [Loa loa]